jgi:hypothetical protein
MKPEPFLLKSYGLAGCSASGRVDRLSSLQQAMKLAQLLASTEALGRPTQADLDWYPRSYELSASVTIVREDGVAASSLLFVITRV